MKKSLSQVLILSAALLLASCGGDQNKSSAAPGTSEAGTSVASEAGTSEAGTSVAGTSVAGTSTPTGTSSRPSGTSTPASTPASTPSSTPAELAYTPAAADIVKENNKAYLKVTGTLTGVTGDAAKFAFGLQHKANADLGLPDEKDGQWLVGSATPAAADYKYAPTIGADGAFEVKIDISEIAFEKGNYSMFVGPNGGYAALAVGQANYGAGNAEINSTKLIFRGDQNLLVAEELPPVHLTEELVEIDATNNKAYLKIGGELTTSEAAFLALTVKVTFERQVGGWQQFPKTGDAVTTVVDGTKGYVKVDITDLAIGGYQVKIGFDGAAAPNTTMEGESYDMRTTASMMNPGTALAGKGYYPYFSAGGGDANTLYGCCGLFIQKAYDIVAGEKATDSELYPLTDANDTTFSGYEVRLDTTNTPNLGNDKKMNSKKVSTFDVTGIAEGQYEVYLKCKCSSDSNAKAVGFSEGAQLSTEGQSGGDPVPGRYYVQSGTEDKEYTNTGDKKFWDCGINGTSMEWINCSCATVNIADGTTSFKFGHTGAGYSLNVEAIRLVKVGAYVRPATPVAFTEGAMKIEAEDAHIILNNKSGTITDEADGEDFSGDKIIAGLSYQAQSGWGSNQTPAVTGELDYLVKMTEAKTVKVKAHLKSNRTSEGKVAEVWVDGEKLGDYNAANTWVDVITSGIKLEVGKHTIAIKGVSGATTDIDYIELVEQAIPAATLKVNYDLPSKSRVTDTVLEAVEGKVPELPTPFRPGAWKFLGWYTEAEAGTKVEAGADLTADMDLYAHWEAYTWVEGTKTGAMQAETSGTDTAIKLAWADHADTSSGFDDTRCGPSGGSGHADWDVTGIEAGTYAVQMSVKGNGSNDNVDWWSSATAAHSRYYFQAGDATVDAPKGMNYESTGLAKGSGYSLTSIFGNIEIAAGTTTFQMQYDGSGYRLYGLEYVRLIKVA